MSMFNDRGPRPSYFKKILKLKRIPNEVRVSIERSAGGQAFVHTGIPVRQSTGLQWRGSDDELKRFIMYWVEKRLAKDHLQRAPLMAFGTRWVGDVLEVIAQYDVDESTLDKWSAWFHHHADGNPTFVRDTIDPIYEEMAGGYYEDGAWDETAKVSSMVESDSRRDSNRASTGVPTAGLSNPHDAVAVLLLSFALSTTEGLTDEKEAEIERLLKSVKKSAGSADSWRDQAARLKHRDTSNIRQAFSNAISYLAEISDHSVRQNLVIFLFLLIRSEGDRSGSANELQLINQACSAFGVDPSTLYY